MKYIDKLVSVIVPLYNSQETIEKTFNSIINQTYKHLEVLLVDDGSIDNTQQIVISLIKSYENAHYFYKENGGVASARNHGIVRAKGEYIAICDHDELWEPYKLEKQLPCFDEAEVGLVYSACKIKYQQQADLIGDEITPSQFYEGKCYYQLLQFNCIPANTVVLRRSCLDKVGLFYESLKIQGVDDKHLWLRFAHEYPIKAIKEPLVTHIITGNNWSLNEDKMMQSAIVCLDDISRLFPESTTAGKTAIRNAYKNTYFHYGQNLFYIKNYLLARTCFLHVIKQQPLHLQALIYLLISLLPPWLISIIRRLH